MSKHVLDGFGPSIIVTLQPSAADLLQEFHLFQRLYALGQRPDTDILCHGHRGAHDISGFLRERRQETHIQFQHVKLVILQQCQGRIPAAEIVHPDLIACLPEVCDHIPHQAFIRRDHAFGDLDMNIIPGNVVLCDRFFHHGKHILHDEVQP